MKRMMIAVVAAFAVCLAAAATVNAGPGDPMLPWVKDASNPVLVPACWAVGKTGITMAVIKEAPNSYKAWYTAAAATASGYTGFNLGYATSTDGLTWTQDATPVMSGTAKGWDVNGIYTASVLKDGDTYRMWYAGREASGVREIGYATSPDGLAWTKVGTGPVLTTANPWEAGNVYYPSVIKDGDVYKMYYSGRAVNVPDNSPPEICYATSADGINWDKPNLGLFDFGGSTANNIVMPLGAAGSFDVTRATHPHVIKDGDVYRMWYGGYDEDATTTDPTTEWAIGYATSTDGINWTKSGDNPVLEASQEWEMNEGAGRGVQTPWVIRDGDTYQMWYFGYAFNNVGNFGYAETEATPVAEPAALGLVGLGLIGLARRRRS